MAHPSARVARLNAARATGSPDRAASATIFAVRPSGSGPHNCRNRPPDRSALPRPSPILLRAYDAIAHPLAKPLDDPVRIHRIQSGSQMSDLGHRRPPLALQAPVHHVAAAHAGAHRDVEDGALPETRADAALRQCCQVAIVSQNGRQTQIPAEPVDQWEVLPAGDVVALAHPALRPVHRTAEPHSDPSNRMGRRQFGSRLTNLFQDAGRARRGIDLPASQFERGVPSPAPTPNWSLVPPISMPRNMESRARGRLPAWKRP